MRLKNKILYFIMFLLAFSQLGNVKAIERKQRELPLKNFTTKDNLNGVANLVLDFKASDVIIHPSKPIIYLTDLGRKRLYSVNYETNEQKFIQFTYSPERMTFANNELYVTLLTYGTHEISYANPKVGAVAIINPDTFTTTDQFDVAIDPYSIEVDTNGYIYLFPGATDPETVGKSYSRLTKKEVASFYTSTYLLAKLNPSNGRLYTKNVDGNIASYTLDNNGSLSMFSGIGFDSSHPTAYGMYDSINFSPDGKYIFTRGGSIFSTSDTPTVDMSFVYKIKDGFLSVAFDSLKERFYINHNGPSSSGTIDAYDMKTFEKIATVPVQYAADFMFSRDDKLISVANTYPLNTTIYITNTSSMTPVVKQNTTGIRMNGNITKVVYDDTTNLAYAIDNTFNDLYVLDLANNQILKTIRLPYRPDNLCISEDHTKIYIVNRDPDYLFTELTLSNGSFRTVSHPSYVSRYDNRVNKILNQGNKIYVTDGGLNAASEPDLLTFDATTLNKINHSRVGHVGAMAVSSDNKTLYCWDQFMGTTSALSKYDITDTDYLLHLRTYPTNFNVDPLDTPVILMEDERVIICKDFVFDMDDLTNNLQIFKEPVYAINKNHSIAASKKSIYYLNQNIYSDFDSSRNDYEVKFFSNAGLLYLVKDNTLYFTYPIPGDTNGDEAVDLADLALAAKNYNSKRGGKGYDVSIDYNYDGIIDVLDMVIQSRLMD